MPQSISQRTADGADRQLHVDSPVYNDSATVEFISEEAFADWTVVDLKRMVHAPFRPESTYSFAGLPLSIECRSDTARALYADLVANDAFPGPNKYWAVRDPSEAQSRILLSCWDVGYLEHEFGQGWRITPFGWNFLKRHRQTSNHRHVFRRRTLVPIRDWTLFELLDLLIEQGWSLKCSQPRVEPPAIGLLPDASVVDSVYGNKFGELSRDYLMCLVDNQKLAQTCGVTELKHKQPVRYYAEMLAKLRGEPLNRPLALVDDSAMLALTDSQHPADADGMDTPPATDEDAADADDGNVLQRQMAMEPQQHHCHHH